MSWGLLRALGASRGLQGGPGEALEGPRRRLGAILEPSWARLGAVLRARRPSLGRLGAILEPSEAILALQMDATCSIPSCMSFFDRF